MLLLVQAAWTAQAPQERPVAEERWAETLRFVRETFPDVPQLPTERLAELLVEGTDVVLLDARSKEEFATSHLQGAVRATSVRMARNALEEHGGKPTVVVYCSVGYRSSRLAEQLRAQGIENVFNLEGSLFKWANEGRPVYQRIRSRFSLLHPFDDGLGRVAGQGALVGAAAVRPTAPARAFPCRGCPLWIATFALALAVATGVSATEPTETDGSPTRADNPARLHELAESVYHHPVWQLALLERAYQGLADANPTGALQAPYARRWLAALLKLGLTDEAVAVFESVPASLRDTTLEFAGTVGLDRWHFTPDSSDLRMEFAAACILEGRLDLAKRLVAAVAAEFDVSKVSSGGADLPNGVSPTPDPADDGHWKPRELGEDGGRLAILRRNLEPSDADPFGLFVGVTMNREAWIQSVTWRRLLARLAEQEGYPSMARFQRRNAGFRLNDRWWDPARVPETAKTRDIVAAVSRTTRAIDRLRSSLEQSAIDQTAAAMSASGVDETIRRLIAAPSVAHIRERPLPNGMTPVTPALTWEQERERRIALHREHKLPLPIIRVDRQGSSVVALGTSYDYDPVAPSLYSTGAYWVFRSHDGGVSWDPPLYTGLRTLIPYVAVPVSHMPMIGPKGLRLEVKVREADPDTIFFPGGFSSYKRKEDGLFVELPWELLERDSDGDGLTDLAEERLLTDPHEADTDRDGLDDREDPLPHVVHADATDPRAALMRAILEKSDGGPLATDNEKTVFVVATRAYFRGTQPVRRTIVLSPEEHAASVTKFGSFFPTHIEPIMINRDGNLAFATWSARWNGGSGIFEKVGTAWVRIGGWSWMT